MRFEILTLYIERQVIAMGAVDTPSSSSTIRMAVVGGTFFKDAKDDNGVRIDCVREFLSRMQGINAATGNAYPVTIADASPGQFGINFRWELEQLGATVIDATAFGGIAPQNQAAIQVALDAGAPYIIRTELEKYGLAVLEILEQIVERLEGDGADILAIGRQPGEAYESLPPYQQISERIMSRALGSLRGMPEDSACGLRAMSRLGAQAFIEFDATTHGDQWEILWFVLLDALVGDLKVRGLFVNLIHPPEMTELETDNPVYDRKRDDQAAMIIPAVVAHALMWGIVPRWDKNRQWVI